ncbi:tRNA (guanosine(46)-N7)-methyltransferase TrmB [Piscirickettsia salmonis]|uniref:tRNA (guanosine(46)-N7)-methyltransferase TrmB n=2 Tax=Piscirickettsia salmonis TaxID=1238 RepID=UPI00031ABFD7|nr:tRNA (guanosine(46)-N7)-methyltransferase TrmB [Piscirickettsia salmonis]APS56942.1 tRNA (guanine-N7)-methyltransferase [Piscirickettsia salmonis]ERL61891.1 tRNA (guanine-N(7)-)-methyltransferase [Piscirickettsia salmonis LF-89 = ATCC VR-1361]PEQ16187.1 tRNA (guanosine(46)-N7)-methyltransferase TrmB [Piscirickettsia salmonis]QGN78315.1 tRNA (guanine-N(7)-)-methyltransferase [Piscirickettsia salmonis]QGN81898.1 tRNA (guanine-N(7)-)-methyltransferase [Piscirickettsia salmonis]
MTQSPIQPHIQTVKIQRKIKSFVRREGRLTKGQEQALAKHWPHYGKTIAEGHFNALQEFTNHQPITLEIGYGMGNSLVTMAKTMPEHNFIGIEVHRPGVGSLLLQMEQENITNIRSYMDDAVEVLKQCIPDYSLSQVQIFFPDPWHKKRHHKRRLIQPTFIDLLSKKLTMGGVIHLATDWENYAEHMMQVLSAHSHFENTAGIDQYTPRPNYRPLTKFEQRGQRLGHGTWDLLFKKIKK